LNPTSQHEKCLKVIEPVFNAARRYHQHQVIGLDNIPRDRGVIVAVNHSLATYDITLLMAAMYSERGIIARPLVDRLFFRVPVVGKIAKNYFGAVEGSPDAAEKLLREGEVITVAPGGMREALRPSSERYQIHWSHRLGFARLAMKTQSPIVLAACPKADDLYDVYPSHLTAWFYQTYRVPVFLARGLGISPLPRPVKLTHYLSQPIKPPRWVDDETEREHRLKKFHAELCTQMEQLLKKAQEN
jgi:1-acyl-sn-glycerol-3-phosphate acyltransferase